MFCFLNRLFIWHMVKVSDEAIRKGKRQRLHFSHTELGHFKTQ